MLTWVIVMRLLWMTCGNLGECGKLIEVNVASCGSTDKFHFLGPLSMVHHLSHCSNIKTWMKWSCMHAAIAVWCCTAAQQGQLTGNIPFADCLQTAGLALFLCERCAMLLRHTLTSLPATSLVAPTHACCAPWLRAHA